MWAVWDDVASRARAACVAADTNTAPWRAHLRARANAVTPAAWSAAFKTTLQQCLDPSAPTPREPWGCVLFRRVYAALNLPPDTLFTFADMLQMALLAVLDPRKPRDIAGRLATPVRADTWVPTFAAYLSGVKLGRKPSAKNVALAVLVQLTPNEPRTSAAVTALRRWATA